MRFHFSPSVFLLTQKATSQLPFRSVLLSLRLEIATGNPHPRQREARAVTKSSSLQTPICPPKSKQARHKPYFSALPSLFIYFCLINPTLKLLCFFMPLLIYPPRGASSKNHINSRKYSRKGARHGNRGAFKGIGFGQKLAEYNIQHSSRSEA